MGKKKIDKVFLWTVYILVFAGIFILASASMGLLTREGADFYNVLFGQIIFGVLGGTVFLITASKINYCFWKKIALPFFILTFLLTLLIFIPHIGFSYGGAKRWIKIGSLFFQPSEILKFGFVVYLAAWISSRKSDIQSFKFGLLPFLLISAFVGIVLILEPDIGTLGVIAFTSLFMLILGGAKPLHIALTIILGMVMLFALVKTNPHAMERMSVFLNPQYDQSGSGYQSKQAIMTIGSGGIFGKGFGMSIQKFKYLPEPIGDSIFAVFGEEFGFAGSVFLIGLFLFFLYRGFSISIRAPDHFGRLLGAGIVILIVVQSFINIAAVTGVIPLTGLPLIFVSKGGTATAIALAEVGILLNISKYAS